MNRDDAVIDCDDVTGAWTREAVTARIREAWDTLRRVPAAGVPGYRCAWPPVVQDYFDAYGYTAAAVRLASASPRAIDRMHQTFGWFAFVGDRDHAQAVWFTCGCGLGPKRVADILGVSRWTVRTRRDEALDRIVEALHKKAR